MVGFGSAFYLLQIERIYRGAIEEEQLLYPYDPSNQAFPQSIMTQYFILLGDFGALQLEDFDSKGNEVAAKILFIFTTVITQILILNMLIALMSETFADYTEKQEEYSQQSKMSMITDYIETIDFQRRYICKCRRRKKAQKKRFLVVITRVVDDDDDDDGIDGENQLNMVKRTIDNRFRTLENLLTKRISKALAVHSVDTKVKLNSLETQGKQRQNEMRHAIQSAVQNQTLEFLQVIDDLKRDLNKSIGTSQKKINEKQDEEK